MHPLPKHGHGMAQCRLGYPWSACKLQPKCPRRPKTRLLSLSVRWTGISWLLRELHQRPSSAHNSMRRALVNQKWRISYSLSWCRKSVQFLNTCSNVLCHLFVPNQTYADTTREFISIMVLHVNVTTVWPKHCSVKVSWMSLSKADPVNAKQFLLKSLNLTLPPWVLSGSGVYCCWSTLTCRETACTVVHASSFIHYTNWPCVSVPPGVAVWTKRKPLDSLSRLSVSQLHFTDHMQPNLSEFCVVFRSFFAVNVSLLIDTRL